MFKPQRLGTVTLPDDELTADKKTCRKIGPCGVGEKAIYLNSFYFDRRYYIPISSVERIFKRIAMSKGGFTGKGAFGTLSYLVVVYENGKEKQCNFKQKPSENWKKKENGWKKSSASAFFRKKSKSGLPSLNAQKIILKSNPITTWI